MGSWPLDCVTELSPEWILPVCAPSYGGGRFSGADLPEATPPDGELPLIFRSPPRINAVDG